ncbi:MAG: hypothetical protein QOH25_2567 [Acidobacteriota bacterium]|jgi:hypothetical protein|nr:hypothetical protein [Acidobacteriota bacterium]
MSYHILHQFDEQWLAELKQDAPGNKRQGFLDSFDDAHNHVRRAKLAAHESKRWMVVAAALLLATFALLFSLDASRRAEALQQRLDALETTVRK